MSSTYLYILFCLYTLAVALMYERFDLYFILAVAYVTWLRSLNVPKVHTTRLIDDMWYQVVRGEKTWELRKASKPWGLGDHIIFTNRQTGERSPVYRVAEVRFYRTPVDAYAALGQALLPNSANAALYDRIKWGDVGCAAFRAVRLVRA